MYNLDWDIRFYNKEEEFKLGILAECEIVSSVENLADTATIALPEAVMNTVLDLENKIGRGTKVVIKLGYSGDLRTEFVGFIQEITTNDSVLKILCEDALFLFKKPAMQQEIKEMKTKELAQLVVNQVDPSFKVVCDHNITHEKFVINEETVYDVLKKIQENTKANIYFKTDKKELHIHAPFSEKGGEVNYSMQHNIESSSLEFAEGEKQKTEVIIQRTDMNGKVHQSFYGESGGERSVVKVNMMTEIDVESIANIELSKIESKSYKGSIDTWLIPFVQPTYTAVIKDKDYPAKDGRYYVTSVTTSFSDSGGKRTIQIGNKVG